MPPYIDHLRSGMLNVKTVVAGTLFTSLFQQSVSTSWKRYQKHEINGNYLLDVTWKQKKMQRTHSQTNILNVSYFKWTTLLQLCYCNLFWIKCNDSFSATSTVTSKTKEKLKCETCENVQICATNSTKKVQSEQQYSHISSFMKDSFLYCRGSNYIFKYISPCQILLIVSNPKTELYSFSYRHSLILPDVVIRKCQRIVEGEEGAPALWSQPPVHCHTKHNGTSQVTSRMPDL